jgi:hypothetical protein
VPKKVTKQVCVQVKKCVEEQVPADEAGSFGSGNGNGGAGAGCGKKGCLRGCKKGC